MGVDLGTGIGSASTAVNAAAITRSRSSSSIGLAVTRLRGVAPLDAITNDWAIASLFGW
jgi:hypothetical protein